MPADYLRLSIAFHRVLSHDTLCNSLVRRNRKHNICHSFFLNRAKSSCAGLALHGNVFHAEDLKKAQKDPEQYKNLQVRVCGWNAYFVNLTKEEQDAFILQAENAL